MLLTPEELRKPDVVLEIPEGRYDRLPKPIYEILRLYVGWARDGVIVFTVPHYRYLEMCEIAKKLKEDT